MKNYFALIGKILYWTILAPLRGQPFKISEVFHQMVLIGVRALPMAALTAFSIGLTLAMQSGAELRRMGALSYVPSLVSVSLLRELGPLLIAVIVVGRSGSAVTAELGTMQVSEEIEALEVMAINPIRFLIVPRVLAMLVMLPALTVFGDWVGMVGGWAICHFAISDTLLSDKFVAFSAGSPDVPIVAPGISLQGRSAGGLEKLADSIGPLVTSFEPLVKRVDTVFQSIEPLMKKTGAAVDTFKEGMGDTFPKISKLADGLKTTSDAANLAIKHVEQVVADLDEPIKTDLKQIKVALVQLNQALGEADRFITHTDKNFGGRLQELAVVLENLKVVSTHAKALTQALGEKPNRLIFSGKPRKLTPEEEILRSDKPLPAVKSPGPEATPR